MKSAGKTQQKRAFLPWLCVTEGGTNMESYQRVSLLRRIIRSKAFTLICLLAGLIILFTILAPLNAGAQFFKRTTLNRILSDLAIPACLALGTGMLMVSGAVDLCASRVGALAAVTLATSLLRWGWPVWLGIVVALAFAACVGLINALLVNELKFQPFIATMAMSTVVYAILMLVSTDKSGVMSSIVNFRNSTVDKINNFTIFGLTWSVVLLVILFLIYGILLSKTTFGRRMYFVGGNRQAARLAGINGRRISYILFINSSVLAGIGGIIFATRTKSGSLTTMATEQFTGMTAAILGGISFGGGSGGMGGAFIGLLVLRTFNQGMIIVGSSAYLTAVLSGALLLAALSMDYFSQRRQQKRVGA